MSKEPKKEDSPLNEGKETKEHKPKAAPEYKEGEQIPVTDIEESDDITLTKEDFAKIEEEIKKEEQVEEKKLKSLLEEAQKIGADEALEKYKEKQEIEKQKKELEKMKENFKKQEEQMKKLKEEFTSKVSTSNTTPSRQSKGVKSSEEDQDLVKDLDDMSEEEVKRLDEAYKRHIMSVRYVGSHSSGNF